MRGPGSNVRACTSPCARPFRRSGRGKPVRLRITFSGTQSITLRLDPKVAPINIANLVLLAKKGYFNGRLVPRVVPDFVVQMGSPTDTMDGGPGYTVRCENSLDWCGPGSVGLALSGKVRVAASSSSPPTPRRTSRESTHAWARWRIWTLP